ncbi:hypothetical protein U1Q18_036083, partial [Sarracenia purpurea var. burkii]
SGLEGPSSDSVPEKKSERQGWLLGSLPSTDEAPEELDLAVVKIFGEESEPDLGEIWDPHRRLQDSGGLQRW